MSRESEAKRIFLEAVEKQSPDYRSAFVREACQDDTALRDRVEALLKAHGESNRMLDGTGPTSEPAQESGHRKMSNSNADRNLLFGILALQMDFITREDLVAATTAWVADKSRPLADILLERGAIDEAIHGLLEGIVAKHLERHDNDPQKSLATLGPLGLAREALRSIADGDIDESLLRVSLAPEDNGLDSTETWAAGAST